MVEPFVSTAMATHDLEHRRTQPFALAKRPEMPAQVVTEGAIVPCGDLRQVGQGPTFGRQDIECLPHQVGMAADQGSESLDPSGGGERIAMQDVELSHFGEREIKE